MVRDLATDGERTWVDSDLQAALAATDGDIFEAQLDGLAWRAHPVAPPLVISATPAPSSPPTYTLAGFAAADFGPTSWLPSTTPALAAGWSIR